MQHWWLASQAPSLKVPTGASVSATCSKLSSCCWQGVLAVAVDVAGTAAKAAERSGVGGGQRRGGAGLLNCLQSEGKASLQHLLYLVVTATRMWRACLAALELCISPLSFHLSVEEFEQYYVGCVPEQSYLRRNYEQHAGMRVLFAWYQQYASLTRAGVICVWAHLSSSLVCVGLKHNISRAVMIAWAA